ncbi:uncharacterized protein LOC125476548 isoform X1 [Pyrus x bretschneideri]|uniref:uncharacterized protein LOC125476546 isoform X1 n=1 Tax=Pyrus x bretschneideri TaxID=225117 RepID=UPI00202F498D|nr:uncharacterized protein LOC125476546 isoform X1 [Pyrus x bretschneideri]XP_048438769.1 uncharacterized protein LOC125476547 isoform X1 [Pyrus x bretschneideri]XP_048438771.1 uncharacterized protein LOC125476548 isoform X1 [Pyrus x bretschneideri]
MSTADGDVSESLSDIDDSEVAGYLNSKEAARFKRFIWEVLNKDYDQGKSRKRARKAKKAAPAEKTAKVSTVINNKEGPGFEERKESNCGSGKQLSNQKKIHFEVSHDEELEHENMYSEEAEAGEGYDDDTHVANDEYNGYNYDEEYNYDEGYNNDDGYDFDEL